MEKAALPLLVFVESDSAHADLCLRAVNESSVETEVLIFRDHDSLRVFLDEGRAVPRLFVLECLSAGIDPHAVLRAIRGNERTQNIPVVIHAHEQFVSDADKLCAGGANSCFEKHASTQQFINRLSSAIRYWLFFNVAVRPVQQPRLP